LFGRFAHVLIDTVTTTWMQKKRNVPSQKPMVTRAALARTRGARERALAGRAPSDVSSLRARSLCEV
jgi:hypothetical protein